MSFNDIMRRVLPPITFGNPRVTFVPHPTSGFGPRRLDGEKEFHKGIDFNYNVGPNGQTGINLTHPALRSPVTGIVTNAGEGTVGRIAIRDANGFSHEILHTSSRDVAVGDPVVAGQLIGTIGNTGVPRHKDGRLGDQHVHYQIRDRG